MTASPAELSRAGAEIDRLAATPRLLVALDFDGTLAPLLDEPMDARMTDDARDAVLALTAAPETVVAFVSGRSLHDLRVIGEHDDDSPILLAGSHGAEFWSPGVGAAAAPDDAGDEALRDRLRVEAEQIIADLDGVWIEPKTFGFAVHSRLASPDDADRSRDAIDGMVVHEAPHWRRRTGHNIVEYAFRHEGKDTAVAALRERVGATAVLFAGDDVTDEDALRSLGAGDLGVHVGAGETAATISVPDIAALARLLRALAERRVAGRE
ncbi:trehalose 6-phosphate phosphatase [Microbacterium sp. AK009]|uniref:trehalose-phosphatase n=1 Tax=Microbacterium sp. AK009 TaxID=2723068 RepID=UPI0015CBE3B9|nr:trehalose-phosphatase [Microbacterium sp. AK009]NYF17225.1 trehalose 6-phosphate phosphatase [Microbacterium sp. AK009]